MSFLDIGPSEGKHVAMAYPRSVSTLPSSKQTPALSRAWEDLRKDARRLETELEVKIAAYAKLCSSYEGHYRGKGEVGLATDQLAQAKGLEIEDLLTRLSDVNDGMTSALSGGNDSRAHTLARHRDILHDYMQEFRRLGTVLGARAGPHGTVCGQQRQQPPPGGTRHQRYLGPASEGARQPPECSCRSGRCDRAGHERGQRSDRAKGPV
eukprot:jgi/Botrbrau1/9796/Bobra.0322s0004.1